MKKLLSLFTAALLAVSISIPLTTNITAFASEYSQNGFTLTYTISGSNALITDCSGSGTSLVIPELIAGFTVSSIEKNAFDECSTLTSITIPNGVAAIKEKAFWNCSALKNVSIGSGLSEIGDYAFSACPALDSFTVSSDNSTFSAVKNMLYSKAGDSLICYAGSAAASIPEGTKNIKKAAFFGNSRLKSVQLPSSLSSIGEYAFSGCFNLGKVTIPLSVTSMGKGCFMNCSSLSMAVLGGGLKEVPEECFSMCTSLESVNIPSSITKIGAQAFFSCAKLSGVYIPITVTSIGTDAVGTKHDIRSQKNIPIKGFYISGSIKSTASAYAASAGVDFLDFANIPFGDVDGNGVVNAVDASLVLSEYANTAVGKPVSFTFYQLTTGDFNSDGSVNAVDASLILALYAKNATGR